LFINSARAAVVALMRTSTLWSPHTNPRSEHQLPRFQPHPKQETGYSYLNVPCNLRHPLRPVHRNVRQFT
jgi:hypothetical protein